MWRVSFILGLLACRTDKSQITDVPVPEDDVLLDADGDGYLVDEDCDDEDPYVYPNADEVCDGIDNDCDGDVDEEVLVPYYLDSDDDGFGTVDTVVESCSAPDGYSINGLDCDDTRADIYPAANEVCDGLDNNCNEEIDEGLLSIYYTDNDGDGFGDINQPVEACVESEILVLDNTDCDDSSSEINPDQEEVCDNIDNDCDGFIDEEVLGMFYLDADSDGFGDGGSGVEACDIPVGYVTNNADCDDSETTTNPSSLEICDGLDNDCDGTADETGSSGEQTYYSDIDGDGLNDILAGQPLSTKPVIF